MLFLKTFKDAKFVVDGNAFQTFITLSTKNFCLMLAVLLGLNSLYLWPLVLVLVLSAEKLSKFTFTFYSCQLDAQLSRRKRAMLQCNHWLVVTVYLLIEAPALICTYSFDSNLLSSESLQNNASRLTTGARKWASICSKRLSSSSPVCQLTSAVSRYVMYFRFVDDVIPSTGPCRCRCSDAL